MNKTHQEQWEDAANLNEDRYIATGWHYNDKLYETSGILTTGHLIDTLIPFMERKDFEKKNLLEIGCGNGRMTKYLAKCFSEIIATDCSKTMLDKGKKRVDDKNINWILNKNDLLTGVFDKSIDIAFSFIVFQHCKAPTIKSYFKEVERVLKPGGIFVFQLPLSNEHKEPGEFNAVANWTLEELEHELKGFEKLKHTNTALKYHVFKKKN